MKLQDEKSVKKTYQSPQLISYGDIAEITRSVGRVTVTDGAAHGSTRTA